MFIRWGNSSTSVRRLRVPLLQEQAHHCHRQGECRNAHYEMGSRQRPECRMTWRDSLLISL